MMHIGHFTFNSFQTSCYIVWDESGNCAFIDPGCSNPKEISALKEFVVSKNLKPTCIMLTHCHFDHIYGAASLSKDFQIPVYAGESELYTLESTNPTVCGAYNLPIPEAIQLLPCRTAGGSGRSRGPHYKQPVQWLRFGLQFQGGHRSSKT